MQRNLNQFKQHSYDLLVIGGGIHGAFVAWDGALRGLKVALIERGDFGSATSANSLKTVHGGLRYLQDGDLKLVRKMIRERKAYLKIAPHLVHPLPCLMPTYKQLKKNKFLMAPALILNDWVGYDRNTGQDPLRLLPKSRLLSRGELLEKLPGIDPNGITGGVCWTDGQIYNSERFLLGILASAVGKGAHIANYVTATQLIEQNGRVTGVKAADAFTAETFEITAKIVVNATGAWTDHLLNALKGDPQPKSRFLLSTAINIVTRKIVDGYGVGITGYYRPDPELDAERSRLLFVSPWRDYSIIGTLHDFYEGDPAEHQIASSKIEAFIAEVNRAYPAAALTLADVKFIHKGFLPTTADRQQDVKLVRTGQVHDHALESGIEGLVSVVGVKYTTAREVAERAIDTVAQKLGQTLPPCVTHVTPLHGGDITSLDRLLAEAQAWPEIKIERLALTQLVYNYGLEYGNILHEYAQSQAEAAGTSQEMLAKAQTRYAVHHEMALTLADVILRRTDIGSAGIPDEGLMAACAETMAAELGWDWDRTQAEIRAVQDIYQTNRFLLPV